MLDAVLVATVIHRTAMVVLLITVVISPLLPRIFLEESDISFMEQTQNILSILSRGAILLLILTGLIRLTGGVPAWFMIKALIVGITVYFFLQPMNYSTSNTDYEKQCYRRMVLVLLTGFVGLVI